MEGCDDALSVVSMNKFFHYFSMMTMEKLFSLYLSFRGKNQKFLINLIKHFF